MAGMIVIDDFHHLKENVRIEISSRLKRWHEQNIRFLIIGIAGSNKKILNVDSELGIRNDVYEMKKQEDKFSENVISLGEQHLNLEFSSLTKESFIKASSGVPSAIQIMCRVACIRNEVRQTLDETRILDCSIADIKDGVIRIYGTKYHDKLIGLCKGKQQSRSVHHTYFDIIKFISIIQKNEIHFQEIKQRILSDIHSPKDKKNKTTSFNNCLKYLPEVIEERGLDDAIYVSKDSETISIEDPSFGLYLSLVDIDSIGKDIKFRKTEFPYEVAFSFAGEDRKIVEDLKNILVTKGYNVFYDFDVQHQLWGTNLRTKLADVYANEAQYMVVFLSEYYCEKDWTNFEFEIGKKARGKRTEIYLLPVLLDDVNIIGLSSDIGCIDLRRCTLQDLADTLIKKIEDN